MSLLTQLSTRPITPRDAHKERAGEIREINSDSTGASRHDFKVLGPPTMTSQYWGGESLVAGLLTFKYVITPNRGYVVVILGAADSFRHRVTNSTTSSPAMCTLQTPHTITNSKFRIFID